MFEKTRNWKNTVGYHVSLRGEGRGGGGEGGGEEVQRRERERE